MTANTREQRRTQRSRRSEAVLWRCLGRSTFDMGWLLESSRDGLAFAWRGTSAPLPGSLLEICREGPEANTKPDRVLVRRVVAAHDDLVVIGGERLTVRPFPPAAAAERAQQTTEHSLALALALAA
ncbi:MAG: hypothetical protein IPJ41_05755 [Phycisphaerales bacterium]|nr:hypothetical protein [Phycisphaerales bacterium]